MREGRPAMLLCDAGYYGTLAAARSLGRRGVPVTVVDASRAAPALWSRHVAQRVRCPPVAEVERFVEWLVAFGQRQPGHAIYATSDELSFVLALHKDVLSETFSLYQPELPVIERILDKGRLLEDARAVGVDVPETRLPEDHADVEKAAREMRGPIMIKPRTQILLTTHAKGALAPVGPGELASAYARFIEHNCYHPVIRKRIPGAMRPMLQRYHPEAVERVYSLTGFRAPSGRVVMLGANKLLQRPRSMGVGLCFEAAAVEDDLAARATRLLDRVGYFGVFELEFISAEGKRLLIDFNPRFYNQIGLDIARGLPLAELAFAGARGEEAEVDRLLASALSPGAADTYAFCNRFSFHVMLRTQRLFGAMSREDLERWRSWPRAEARTVVDAVADPDDPRPYVAEIAKQLFEYVTNPRLFWRVHRPRREAS